MAILDSCPILLNPIAHGITAKRNAEKKAAVLLTNFSTRKNKATTDNTPLKADMNLIENSFNPNKYTGINNKYLCMGRGKSPNPIKYSNKLLILTNGNIV